MSPRILYLSRLRSYAIGRRVEHSRPTIVKRVGSQLPGPTKDASRFSSVRYSSLYKMQAFSLPKLLVKSISNIKIWRGRTPASSICPTRPRIVGTRSDDCDHVGLSGGGRLIPCLRRDERLIRIGWIIDRDIESSRAFVPHRINADQSHLWFPIIEVARSGASGIGLVLDKACP